MSKARIKMTGRSLSVSQFQIHETVKIMDVEQLLAVLKGDLAGCLIRQYIPDVVCSKISENFWASRDRVPRLGYGKDGIEGYIIGASHIEKTTRDYLDEVNTSKEAVQHLFQGTQNPVSTFKETLASAVTAKMSLRPAKHDGVSAGDLKAACWHGVDEFLLHPHDDFAQLTDPLQRGFEIQKASRVMAVNFYVTVPERAGQLKLWNIEPDHRARAALNLTYSGFPYPAELLEEFSSIVIPVVAGDVCIINGNLVHAVMRGGQTVTPQNRLLITFFMTFNDKHELIWWT